jgi:hypothetical protein
VRIDVLAAERRQVGEMMIGNVLGLTQGSDCAVQIASVPQGNGRDEKVEAGSAVLLVLVGAVADFAEPMNKDGARHAVAVARFALVELAASVAAQLRVFNPIEREQGPLEQIERFGRAVMPEFQKARVVEPAWARAAIQLVERGPV